MQSPRDTHSLLIMPFPWHFGMILGTGANTGGLVEYGRRQSDETITGVRIYDMKKTAASALCTGYTLFRNGIHSVRKEDILT